MPGDKNTWYIVALLVSALGTLVIGFLIGTTTEGSKAEKTLEANRIESTQAVGVLGTLLADNQVDAVNAMATQQGQAVAAIASSEADRENALATSQAQATAAIGVVTQVVGEQQTATSNANATATAIVEAYTPTPTVTPTGTVTPSATFTSTPATPQGEVLPVTTSVRLGPGDEFPVVDTIGQDTAVEILSVSEDGRWVEIQYVGPDEAIMSGYVVTEAVRRTAGSLQGVGVAQNFPTLTYTPSPIPSETPVPTDTATPLPPPSETPTIPEGAVLAIAVTVYGGPGEDYPVVDVIGQDTHVQIMGTSADGQWFQISYFDGEGFVRSSSLRLTAGSLSNLGVAVASMPTVSPTPPPPTPSAPEAAAAGQFVVVREGPGEVFNALGVVPANEQLDVTAVSTDGLWFQVAYERGPDGFGWVSGQVVNLGGDLSNLPAVQGPPPPVVSTGGTQNGVTGSGASTSAGSMNPVDTAALPDNLNLDYSTIPGLSAYGYEIAFAVNGIADGEEYQSLLQIEYTQAEDAGQTAVSMNATGGFLETFEAQGLESLNAFLPLHLGTYEGEGYFYSEQDGICFGLGQDVDLQEFNAEFGSLFGEESLSFFDNLPEGSVFGVVDENGLMGLSGVHYQYLGINNNGTVVPNDDIKLDLWWTSDESHLFGYRMTLNLTADLFFLYRDSLAQFDSRFNEFDTFEGTLTLYLLPTAIGSAANDLATPPEPCNDILNIE